MLCPPLFCSLSKVSNHYCFCFWKQKQTTGAHLFGFAFFQEKAMVVYTSYKHYIPKNIILTAF
jgi:hypothetical protein